MKRVITILLALVPFIAFSQQEGSNDGLINKGSGILYFEGRPSFDPTPFTDASEFAIDLNTKKVYVYSGSGSVWNRYNAIDTLSTLADTANVDNRIGQLVYVNALDEFWHVQSDGYFYPLNTVATLSSLSDTTAAANNVGRIVHVVDVDQKWTVNSAGSWEVLSGGGGTDDQTAAEVTTTALNYERNTVTNVQQGLAEIDSNLIELSGIVNVPEEVGITLPFIIYKTGRDTSATYTITKDFSLQDFATCPAVDTLYVDPSTGNDSNDGQSFSTPLFSIDKAIELINASGQCYHIELQSGVVFTAETGWENIIANVGFSMNCNNSLIHDDQQHLLGAWSAVFNYHQAALNGTSISGVVDTTQTNSFGEFLSLTEVSSTAEVNTTNNSWYEDGTNIYINTNSNTAPDGRIIISGGSAYEWDIQASAGSFYIKNARTEGVTIRTRNSGGRYTLAIDSSEMTRPSGSLIWGVDSYFFNSLFHGGTGDLINLDVESGYIAKHIDYNNTYYHNTEDNTADACGNCQLSTGHQDTRLVQINTTFGIVPNGAGAQRDNVTGQPVAHVTDSKFLMVGCDIGGSQTNGLTINSNVKAWIEGTNARLQDNGNDLQVDAGCIANVKGNYFPTISNAGTISNYYYNPESKKIQPYQIEGITGIDRDTGLVGGVNRVPTSQAVAGKIENTKNALQSAIEAVLPTGVQGQSVFFNASDELAASNFLYHDQINNRLGLNTTTPSAFFEAEIGAGNVYFRFDAQTSGQDVGIQLNDGAGQSWTIGTNNTNNSGSLNITTLDGISSPTRLILARNGYLGLGLNNTQPSDRLEVVGSVNSSAGYKVAGAATTGQYLRGNGTNFVSSVIQEADLPDRPISAITGLAHNVTTATTDASGDIVVTHGLGATPTTVMITGGTNDDRTYQVLEASKNGTTFTVRVYDAGSTLVSSSATFNWIAIE
jgi:hypothetical protein